MCSHRHVCARSMGNNSPVFFLIIRNRSIIHTVSRLHVAQNHSRPFEYRSLGFAGRAFRIRGFEQVAPLWRISQLKGWKVERGLGKKKNKNRARCKKTKTSWSSHINVCKVKATYNNKAFKEIKPYFQNKA